MGQAKGGIGKKYTDKYQGLNHAIELHKTVEAICAIT